MIITDFAIMTQSAICAERQDNTFSYENQSWPKVPIMMNGKSTFMYEKRSSFKVLACWTVKQHFHIWKTIITQGAGM